MTEKPVERRAKPGKPGRGKLSIFLGYAEGVGKTYAMLEAARARSTKGVDVLIACVDTHDQPETQALVQGLASTPCGAGGDLDMEVLLRRRPGLAIVDDLAHSNAPGARHPKRHQDVQELLDAGIDVYTTLNVQDIESLNDVIAQITGLSIPETIPDRVLDQADEINLVDLSPAELLQRLQEGKVVPPGETASGPNLWYRLGNLTALRELALRRAAARVDDQMRAYMDARAIPGPWPAAARLLVCVSPGTLSERSIRTARQLADDLKAEWFAVYVETPDHGRLAPTERGRIARMLHLAEELGAKVVTLTGPHIAETILYYARTHNITKIIAGKHAESPWTRFWRTSVVDELLRGSGDIDVYVVSGEAERGRGLQLEPWKPHRPWRRYALSAGLVGLITLLSALVVPGIDPTNLIMVYLVAVVIAAIYLGRGPSVLAAILGVLALDFFFVPPHFTFAVADTQYLLTFVGLLIVGLVISALTARVREQADIAERREMQTAALYEFTRDLAASVSLDDILQTMMRHVQQTFGRGTIIWLPQGNNLEVRAHSPALQVTKDQAVAAQWAFEHGEPAGQNTTTLAATGIRCMPLKTAHGIVGVLGIGLPDSSALLPQEQRRLLESFANQAALAIERAHFAEQARQTLVLQAAEKLQTALLNSISHDLRTPLVSITGTLSTLQEDANDSVRQSMIETAYGEARRLNHLVGNLLDMTRIEAGAMRLRQEPCDVQDIIGSALEQLSERLKARRVMVALPPELPLVPMDFVLIVQVVANLVDNAVKYSAADAPIDIHACISGDRLEISVADRGIGIPTADLERVFDKFYRVRRPDGVSGTGLGLAICKGIAEAHAGEIKATNREGGGTVVTLTLPLTRGGTT